MRISHAIWAILHKHGEYKIRKRIAYDQENEFNLENDEYSVFYNGYQSVASNYIFVDGEGSDSDLSSDSEEEEEEESEESWEPLPAIDFYHREGVQPHQGSQEF